MTELGFLGAGNMGSAIMRGICSSDMQISVSEVDPERLPNHPDHLKDKRTAVVYMTGPLYFGTANILEDKLSDISDREIIILSMRGVPFADASGVQALQEVVEELSKKDVMVFFTAIQPPVMEMIDRCGLSTDVGSDKFFWSTDKAIDAILTEN